MVGRHHRLLREKKSAAGADGGPPCAAAGFATHATTTAVPSPDTGSHDASACDPRLLSLQRHGIVSSLPPTT
ncbi:hypothetical protein BHE74_00025398 [Ensete ventricosum]|nr:hypothetical protein BHE74_00025398 [Ensete ventricosum]